MKKSDFILTIIKAIEKKFKVISWGHEDSNLDKSSSWWFISINNYDTYVSEDFKKFTKIYYKIAERKGLKIIFSFCKEDEKRLYKMYEENNLVMNIG